jgi:hypothetical protein
MVWSYLRSSLISFDCVLFSSTMGKYQYHKNLGQSLYEVSKGQTLGESALAIVFQINRGLQLISHTPAMSIDMAELNLVICIKYVLNIFLYLCV